MRDLTGGEKQMLKLNGLGAPAALLLSTLVLPRAAAAEPVTITSGNVETQLGLGLARVVFHGNDFFLQLGVEGFFAQTSLECTPCTPGTTTSLSGGFRDQAVRAAGAARVDGVDYPGIFADGMKGTFTTSSFRLTGNQTTTVRMPFTYSGDVRGYVQNPFVVGFTEPAFVKTLTGKGTASARFIFNDQDGSYFNVTDLRYDFGDSSPVPEPATFLLCGFGTALLARHRARRRAE
jgi:PEP-CTERM motif-containing protein